MAEYIRIDAECEDNEITDRYNGIAELVDEATRYYHEHFNMNEDYEDNFEVLTYSQALEFWEANGYEICMIKKLNYKGENNNV